MTTCADFAFRQSHATMECFRHSVGGIARYFDGGRVPGKGLTFAEALDAKAVGLHLHSVYETSGGADIAGFPQNGDYFTHDQGHQDWLEAVVDANSARQPKATPIYLAVDRHMPTDDGRLRAYFQGATGADWEIGGSGYLIGCYGPDYVCAYIRDTFGITHLWPWLPRPPAYPQFDYDLWQQENGQTLCGVAVDLNDCQHEGWTTEQEDNMADETTIREWAKQEARAVIAQEYGPALEDELKQRLAANSAADVGAAVAASLKAAGERLAGPK